MEINFQQPRPKNTYITIFIVLILGGLLCASIPLFFRQMDSGTFFVIILFFSILLVGFIGGVVKFRQVWVTTDKIKVKYAFLKNKSFEKGLNDCDGFLTYECGLYGRIFNMQRTTGVVMKFKDGNTINLFAVFGLSDITNKKTTEGKKIQMIINNLKERKIKEFKSLPYGYTSITNAERLAKRTFSDPNYEPSLFNV